MMCGDTMVAPENVHMDHVDIITNINTTTTIIFTTTITITITITTTCCS